MQVVEKVPGKKGFLGIGAKPETTVTNEVPIWGIIARKGLIGGGTKYPLHFPNEKLVDVLRNFADK